MHAEAVYLAVVLALALGASFSGRLRLDLAAVLLLLSLVVPWRRAETGELVGILSTDEAFSGFGSPAVVMVAAIFVLSHAMERSGAAEMLGARLLSASAGSESRLQFAVLVLATLFSAFVSDTTTVLVWMPLVLAVSRERGFSSSRLLMPLAFAALLGGQWTLIGTRANVVVSDFLRSQDGEGLGFFSFTPVAVLVWIACALWFVLVGRRFLPAGSAVPSLTSRYEVTEYLTEVMASPSSEMIGRSLAEIDLGERASVLGVIRGSENLPPSPGLVVRAGDVLVVQGGLDTISDVVARPGMTVLEEMQLADTTLKSVDLRMVEAIVVPGSPLLGRSLAEANFHREHDLSVLAVGRAGKPLKGRPLEQPLQVGDALLLVGHTDVIARLRGNSDVYLTETRTLPLQGKAWTAIAWMLFLILVTSTRLLDPAVAIVIAAVGCLLTGCASVRGAYLAIDWRVVVLLGSMIPYGQALQITGTAELVARSVSGPFGELGPQWVLGALLLMAVLLTQVLENSATAVVLSPVAYELARSVDANPAAFLIGMALCCSAGFATPVAHECTLLVMGPGGYRLRDFLVVGLPLALITWIVTVLVVPLVIPLR